MRSTAICLLSGGLDSAVTAFYAKDMGYDIATLTILYGQRHEKEIEAAKKISHHLNVVDHVILPLDLSSISKTSLLKVSENNIPHHHIHDIGKTIPSSYVPSRNIVFLSLAMSWAESINAKAIFLGINAVDYSGYPDCRPEFIESFEKMVLLGTKSGVEGHQIQIMTPLIEKTKKEIIQLGKQLSVPFELTWSCYNGKKKACGLCDSCQLRLKGFSDAGLKDPLLYQSFPEWFTD